MARRQRVSKRSPEFAESDGPRGFFGGPTLVLFWIFVVAACVAAAIPTLPQYRLLQEIEAELAEVRKEEDSLREKGLQLKAEARALKNNTRYLEARARDPLRLQLDGETVIELDSSTD